MFGIASNRSQLFPRQSGYGYASLLIVFFFKLHSVKKSLALLWLRKKETWVNIYFFFCDRHADIRDAIMTLVGAVREQTGKLERHELRERQLGDALTRVLRDVDGRTRGQDKNLENLAILMARMDERLRKMEEMVIQVSLLINHE